LLPLADSHIPKIVRTDCIWLVTAMRMMSGRCRLYALELMMTAGRFFVMT